MASMNRLPKINIEGGAELAALLKGLADKEIVAAVKKGMRAVGTKTMKAARAYLTQGKGVDTGALQKSLGIRKIYSTPSRGRIILYMGPRRGFDTVHPRTKKKHDPFYIGHLVEFGHRIAVSATTGRITKGHKLRQFRTGGGDRRYLAKGATEAVSAGDVPAIPFLRPAVDANRTEFVNQMKEKIKDVLVKARAKKAKT